MNRDNVVFRIISKYGADLTSIKSDIERLADNISVRTESVDRSRQPLITGLTSQDTYERVFNAKLEYGIRMIPLEAGGSQEVYAWRETKPATIPLGLENKILYVSLEPGLVSSGCNPDSD